MSRNVRFRLTADELELVATFSRAVGQPIDRVAKQALFWTMNRMQEQAKELREQTSNTLRDRPSDDREESGNSGGDPLQAEQLAGGGAEVVDTGSLADPEGD